MVTVNLSIAGATMKKKTKGRKKIEIKKIEETNSRQVTFSKRLSGLFKKASELCVLTGAQIAIFVNSPGGRVFAFGHPNADNIVDRYLNENTTENSQPPSLPMNLFNQHYGEVSKELEMEKKRQKMIVPVGNSDGLRWYEEDVSGMEVEGLEQYLCSLEQLKKNVVMRADELMMIKKTPLLLGSNAFWNDNTKTMDIATTTTAATAASGAAVHGGFDFHHGGEIGRF